MLQITSTSLRMNQYSLRFGHSPSRICFFVPKLQIEQNIVIGKGSPRMLSGKVPPTYS